MTGQGQGQKRAAPRVPVPEQADFSPRAVSRAVLKETLQRPYVLYPAAVGILGGIAALALGPGALFLVPAALGAAAGVGAWVFDFGLRRERHAADYVRRLQQALAGRIDQVVEATERELRELGEGAAVAQLDRFRAKYRACEDMLRRKLDPSEMTFARYLGMTEQVFLAGLDNLRQIADAVHTVRAMDPTLLASRARELTKLSRLSAAQRQEVAAIEDSLKLREQQLARIQGWLAENEAAMNQMDRVLTVIADLDTAQDHAQMDMQPAMQELKSLLERAHNYARSGDPGPSPDGPTKS